MTVPAPVRGRFGARSQLDPHTAVEVHTITTPRTGPGREKARGALFDVLDRAADQGHRVAFRVWIRNTDTPITLGSKGGYNPATASSASRTELNDPFAWLHTQLDGRSTATVSDIDRVDVRSAPATS